MQKVDLDLVFIYDVFYSYVARQNLQFVAFYA
jgi:hypothetical protein